MIAKVKGFEQIYAIMRPSPRRNTYTVQSAIKGLDMKYTKQFK